MKIISWNINGLRAIEKKGELQVLVEREQPDILMLQEAKGTAEVLQPVFAKYEADWHICHNAAAKAGYSGTTTLVRKSLGLNFECVLNLPNYQCDEGRVCRVDLVSPPDKGDLGGSGSGANSPPCQGGGKEISIINCYFPNGGKSETAWQEKLKFYEAFLEYANQLRGQGKTVIWGGDINCAHEEIDIARPKENDGKVGFHPAERAWVSKCVAQGWCDIWRSKHSNTLDQYSWWTYRGGARERNVGWRIDYLFCDKNLLPQVQKIEYLQTQMGSDHCPLLLEVLN
jgi:exodeoxyribonuclease-3